MSRYIDADALIDFIDVGHLRHPSELCFSEIDVVNLLLHAPTADVEPVVHGRWVNTHSDSEFVQCSLCKYPVYAAWNVTSYCPNCGAKMDEERK